MFYKINIVYRKVSKRLPHTMDLIPRFYRSDIQESISIKGSCGSFRIRPRSQLQNSLNTSIESNKYLEKVLKSSNKQLKPVKQERNTSASFNHTLRRDVQIQYFHFRYRVHVFVHLAVFRQVQGTCI